MRCILLNVFEISPTRQEAMCSASKTPASSKLKLPVGRLSCREDRPTTADASPRASPQTGRSGHRPSAPWPAPLTDPVRRAPWRAHSSPKITTEIYGHLSPDYLVDTTVVEANIDHPSDSGLCEDSIRVLSRAMRRLTALG